MLWLGGCDQEERHLAGVRSLLDLALAACLKAGVALKAPALIIEVLPLLPPTPAACMRAGPTHPLQQHGQQQREG